MKRKPYLRVTYSFNLFILLFLFFGNAFFSSSSKPLSNIFLCGIDEAHDFEYLKGYSLSKFWRNHTIYSPDSPNTKHKTEKEK